MAAQGLRAGLGTYMPVDRCADMRTGCIDPAQSISVMMSLASGSARLVKSFLRRCAGNEIISQQLSFGERAYWEGVVALIGLTLALNLIAYWTLRRCHADC